MDIVGIKSVKKNIKLIYPTGETVPIHSRAVVKVELGKFSLKLPMFVANITDDYLLGVDFLSLIGVENDLRSALGIPQEELVCA